MAIQKNFYIYAGLTILALALSSISIFSWLNGVRPGVLSAPGSTAYFNRSA